MITLLATPAELEKQTLQVGGESYRHLFRARRVAVGERLRVVDGVGVARSGVVVGVDRSSAEIELGEPMPANEPPLYLELFCALPKPERTAWLVEKATEVGVSAVRFMASERAPRQLSAAALARLRRVSASAVEQCHRARLPELSGVHEWSAVRPMIGRHELRVALDASGEAALPSTPLTLASAALVIGPEGGLTPSELEELDSLGFGRLRLGGRILRTETAAIAGAVLLLAGRD